jgi:hypothetical protein
MKKNLSESPTNVDGAVTLRRQSRELEPHELAAQMTPAQMEEFAMGLKQLRLKKASPTSTPPAARRAS